MTSISLVWWELQLSERKQESKSLGRLVEIGDIIAKLLKQSKSVRKDAGYWLSIHGYFI
jgi:hypothetical protein